MNKLEQAARQAFETWWEREGQEFLYALNTTTDDDIKLVAEIAWKNGACCAEQVEQEPVGYVDVALRIKWLIDYDAVSKLTGHKLYAAPVRTKDLTDAEIATLIQRYTIDGKIMPFALCEAVIAADREKNK